ncbi:ATG4B isoform 18 [Pongo abelii]|uniref:Cysteine protease ATG4B n=1 Tax=Pongo abelii TaxID=9601 RepID=A0A2J8RPS1_PONAB|nr:ATG4B isoform 3 [Pongo abelii]PNJ10526.1 ATG4B isoform 6 [Pongo abelii]PNJ10530.1 ATG4B isoform 18 [Pongo abelii]
MDAATLTYDTLRFAEFEDFPETSEPVWILGRKYSIFTEKDEILSDVASRLWFTYRKNFPAIAIHRCIPWSWKEMGTGSQPCFSPAEN